MATDPHPGQRLNAKWHEDDFTAAWIRSQGDRGDAWKQELIHPIVRALCHALASRSSPYVVPLQGCVRKRTPESASIPRVRVVDLGCGHGSLGTALGGLGVDYTGVDDSPQLVAEAVKRDLAVCGLDLDAVDGRSLSTLFDTDLPSIATCVNVLEYLASPGRFLATLGELLASTDRDVPLLVVTLGGPYHNTEEFTAYDEFGLPHADLEIRIESANRTVPARLRPHSAFETMFRDAGFLLRACEPLTLAPDGAQTHDWRPPFWGWLLSARRRRCSLAEAGEFSNWSPGRPGLAARLFSAFRSEARFFAVPNEAQVITPGSLGGEAVVVVRGAGVVSGDRVAFPVGEGDLLGELEASDSTSQPRRYLHSFRATRDDTIVAVFPARVVTAGLLGLRDDSPDTYSIFATLRDRIRHVPFSYGTQEIVGGWPDDFVKEYPPVARAKPQYLWRAARAVAHCADLEQQRQRFQSGDAICLIDVDPVTKQFHPASSKEDDFRLGFRLLAHLGVVEAYSLGAITNHTVHKSIRDTIWQSVLVRTAEKHLPAALPFIHDSEPWLAWLKRHVPALVEKLPTREIPEGDLTKIETAIARNSKSSSDPAAIVKRWSAPVQRCIDLLRGEHVFMCIVRDMYMLERIATAKSEKLERMVMSRLIFRDSHLEDRTLLQWQNHYRSGHPRRVEQYLRRVQAFVEADMAREATLRCSHE